MKIPSERETLSRYRRVKIRRASRHLRLFRALDERGFVRTDQEFVWEHRSGMPGKTVDMRVAFFCWSLPEAEIIAALDETVADVPERLRCREPFPPELGPGASLGERMALLMIAAGRIAKGAEALGAPRGARSSSSSS